MKIDWSPFALRDRIDNFYHIANDSLMSANKVDDAIEASADRLIDFPHLGRKGRVEGTRELVVAGLPYILIYHSEGDCVRILRVLHSAQQWPDTVAQ